MAGGGQVSPFLGLCPQQSFSWALQTESNKGSFTDLWLKVAHCGSGDELVSQKETGTGGFHHWAEWVLNPTEDRGWATAHLVVAHTITGPTASVIYLWEEREVKDHKDLYSSILQELSLPLVAQYLLMVEWECFIFVFLSIRGWPLLQLGWSSAEPTSASSQSLCFPNSSRYFLLLQFPYLIMSL